MTDSTAFIRGENGTIFEMDWPLRYPDMAKRFKAGMVVRVNADGSPYTGPAEPVTVPEPHGEDDETDPEIAALLRESASRRKAG